MKNTLRTMVLSLALSVGTAYADRDGLFYGVNVADADVEIDKSISGVQLHLGYQFNKYLGAEGRVGVFSNEAASVIRDPLYRQFSLHGRIGYQWEEVSVHALLGFASTSSSFDDTEAGFSKGVEINLFGSPSTAVSLGYLSHDDALNVVSIGFVHYLGIKSDALSLRNPSKDKNK